MDLLSIALLLFAGVSGGVISAIAGGASIITFPILLATGITPVTAAVTNSVALTASNIIAAVTERSQLPPLGRSFVWLVITSSIATLAGGALLTLTSERVFALLIPALLGFATLLFAFTERIAAWIRARATARGGSDRWTSSIIWMMPVSVYGGYFGSGIGILALAVLTIGTGGDYRSANAIKNLLIGINTGAVAVYFLLCGLVAFPHVLLMTAGAIAGGFLGARVAQRISNEAARWMVVVIGAGLTIAFAWRYWF